MSEITRAYAVYKGQQYNASYDSGTQLWDVDSHQDQSRLMGR